jgi:HD superfamily phosphohydrolase YqeK
MRANPCVRIRPFDSCDYKLIVRSVSNCILHAQVHNKLQAPKLEISCLHVKFAIFVHTICKSNKNCHEKILYVIPIYNL